MSLSARALVVLVIVGFVGLSGPAAEVQAAPVADTCIDQTSGNACDVDDDGINDAVEIVVCGSATCANGREDSDKDGLPDWIEVRTCAGVSCVDPSEDSDRDGVPDFAQILSCESATCAGARADIDGDGVSDWVEVVICGTETCATGTEDYNGNGVADAVEIAACAFPEGTGAPRRGLASTGLAITIGAVLGLAAALVGGGAVLRRRSRSASVLAATSGDVA